MKIAVTLLVIALAGVSVFGQATLRVVTDDPNLPSQLFYGNVLVKPLRVRPGTTPPQFITIDDTDFFVQQHYVDFLNRMPDPSGFAFWNGNINNCLPQPSCIDAKRVDTSAAYFLSIEFQGTGYLVERMYKVAYGPFSGLSTFGGGTAHNLEVPIVRLNEFLPDTKQIGQGVIVGQTGWEDVLKNNKATYAADFVSRSKFTNIYGPSMPTTQFVDTLNANAGNPLSTTERNNLVAGLDSQTMTRGQVVQAIAEDPDLYNSELNRAFVLMQYFGYLRRDPNNGNGDTDYTGYDFWLTKLNQFNGNYQTADMVKSFIVAGEYKGRF